MERIGEVIQRLPVYKKLTNMKEKKIKKYRLSISRVFPKRHIWEGCDTNFEQQIKDKIKIHTIRNNFPLWKRRIDEVNAGNAVLVLYEWTGKPYNSKTKTLFTFDKDSGIGVQKIEMRDISGKLYYLFTIDGNELVPFVDYRGEHVTYWAEKIAKNDGLGWHSFKDWFRKYELREPMAIIHFTKFRY
ncbi:hypothetical protein FACS1894195_0500 [Bacteroidia bacterium]|nr:hypothetical protein FACS1894195_0500 [Bacteroidia bacterium]